MGHGDGSTCAARRDGPFYDRSMSARWRWRCHRLRRLVQRGSKFARVIHWLKKCAGLLRHFKIESARKFWTADAAALWPMFSAQRSYPRQCRMQKCTLGSDRRIFVPSPREFSVGWHLRSVPAHGYSNLNRSQGWVGSAQKPSSRSSSRALPRLRSSAQMGSRGCVDRRWREDDALERIWQSKFVRQTVRTMARSRSLLWIGADLRCRPIHLIKAYLAQQNLPPS